MIKINKIIFKLLSNSKEFTLEEYVREINFDLYSEKETEQILAGEKDFYALLEEKNIYIEKILFDK